jgi:3-deoxy-7-phosphoheptulonate synthase
MTIVLSGSSGRGASRTRKKLEMEGYNAFLLPTSRGSVCTVLNIGESDMEKIRAWHRDVSLVESSLPYILASRQIKDTQTVIPLAGGASIGGRALSVIAGPCSIESEEQIMEAARCVKEAGASVLRGGVFKPRSSPYAFQGMGNEGLRLLKQAGASFGLPVVTEVMDPEDIPFVEEHSDIIQVGARNCQNYSLLRKLGKVRKPVLLKRGMMVTIEEFLLSAEYILSGGNLDVILCERGIRTFETETRNTLDISAVPILKDRTHLPVFVDPSHASGYWKLIQPLSMAAVAAGADGLMIEVHPHPEKALCDGRQSLRPEKFMALMRNIREMASVMGRTIE